MSRGRFAEDRASADLEDDERTKQQHRQRRSLLPKLAAMLIPMDPDHLATMPANRHADDHSERGQPPSHQWRRKCDEYPAGEQEIDDWDYPQGFDLQRPLLAHRAESQREHDRDDGERHQ